MAHTDGTGDGRKSVRVRSRNGKSIRYAFLMRATQKLVLRRNQRVMRIIDQRDASAQPFGRDSFSRPKAAAVPAR
jgi:hypothetical protein